MMTVLTICKVVIRSGHGHQRVHTAASRDSFCPDFDLSLFDDIGPECELRLLLNLNRVSALDGSEPRGVGIIAVAPAVPVPLEFRTLVSSLICID